MFSIVSGIEKYYKKEYELQLTRHLSLCQDKSSLSYDIELTSDCPYYFYGIRGLKCLNQTYYFDIDLSFLVSDLFKHSKNHSLCYLYVISNELNLSNLSIDLSSFSNILNIVPKLYFSIDMSGHRLVLKEHSNVRLDFYNYLNLYYSGVTVEFYNYVIDCVNSNYDIDLDAYLNDLLTNFNHLFLSHDNQSPMYLSSKSYNNNIVLRIDLSFNDSIEEFMDFISSLNSILLSSYYTDDIESHLSFNIEFSSYDSLNGIISEKELYSMLYKMLNPLFDYRVSINISYLDGIDYLFR